MGHHAPAGGHEFLDVLRRALPGRHDLLPAAGAGRLAVVLLALHLGFPRRGPAMADMARLAPGRLAVGILAAAPGPAGPDSMAALPLFELALQLLKLRPQGGILALLVLELLAQLPILALKFLDAESLCHTLKG
jgi:hypothetical protein